MALKDKVGWRKITRSGGSQRGGAHHIHNQLLSHMVLTLTNVYAIIFSNNIYEHFQLYLYTVLQFSTTLISS